MHLRKVATGLVGVLSAASLVALPSSQALAAKAHAKPKPVSLAYFSPIKANTYSIGQLNGVQKEATKLGASLTVFDAQLNPATQVAQIEDATTSGKFNAYVVGAIDGNAVVPALEQAIAKGIKVVGVFVAIGPDISSIKPQIPGMSAFVGQPLLTNGKAIGQLIVNACASRNPCNVAYMPGYLQVPLEKVRLDAVQSVLDRYPSIKLVSTQAGSYLPGPALTAATNVLQVNPGLNVYATSSDQMTIGVEQAVNQAGLGGKVKLVSSAYSTQGAQAVRTGRWFGEAIYLPFKEGSVSAQLAIEAARGQRVPSSVNELSFSSVGAIVTKSTVSKVAAEWTA